jgi:capsular polysaccharide transport system permease protein
MLDMLGIAQFVRRPASSHQSEGQDAGDVIVSSKPGRKLRKQRQLLLVIGVPLLVSFFYFYFVGRDRYIVSSEVVVRKANDAAQGGLSLGSILGGGNQQSLEDARYLRTYLQSPQVLEDLDRVLDFKAAYAKKGLDIYAGLDSNASRERSFEFFKRQVSISLNEGSGELAIRTYGFTPSKALVLNQFLISQAEIFVNRLNQDVYRKQIDFALQQVNLNSDRVKIASQQLQQFQRQNQVLDAKSEGQGDQGFISALEGELAKERVQLATLRRQFRDPKAPEIDAAQAQVQELQQQIRQERQALVSPGGKNLSQKAAKQAELEANLNFATDLYKAAITSAEKNRVDSLQQQRFMAVLSKPLKPEDPSQYWRHKGFLTALSILVVGFALTKFLLGMADSHRN